MNVPRRALLGVLFSLVCGTAIAAQIVRGSGHAATEARAVAGYHAIAVSVPSQVELVQGDAQGATITADDNLLAKIATVVEDGTLSVRFAPDLDVRPKTPIRITVHARSVDGLSLVGAVRLQAARLQGESLSARLAGAARLVLPQLAYRELALSSSGHGHGLLIGRVENFDLHVAGAGEFNAVRLQSERVKVDISGSAKAVAWVHERLAVKITGAGSVRYFGDPALDKRIVGAGEVLRMGAAPP